MASGNIMNTSSVDVSSLVNVSTGTLAFARKAGNVVQLRIDGISLSSGYGYAATFDPSITPSHSAIGIQTRESSGHRVLVGQVSATPQGVYCDTGSSSSISNVTVCVTYII